MRRADDRAAAHAAAQENALHGTREAIENTEAIFNGDSSAVTAHSLSERTDACDKCHAKMWKGFEDKRKITCCRDGASCSIPLRKVPPEGSVTRVIHDLG